MARAVHTAALGGGRAPRARLIAAEAADPDELLAAGGFVFACPENLAAMSGEMKAFFDRAYYPALGRIEGRPCALMVCAGVARADALDTLREFVRDVKSGRAAFAQTVTSADGAWEATVSRSQLSSSWP